MNLSIRMGALTFVLCLVLLTTPVTAEESEIEQLKQLIESLQKRIEKLEASQAQEQEDEAEELEEQDRELEYLRERVEDLEEPEDEYNLDHARRMEQFGVEEDKPELEVDIGGAIWFNFAHQNWKSDEDGRKEDMRFDNLRLAVDATYGNFLMSAQYRFYSYADALHHAWIGYQFEEDNRIELGISQVPFGILPFGSHNFWFMIPYYVGLEDDYDAGIKWHYGLTKDWTLDAAFYFNEEYGDTTELDRYSVDVVREGDQQNEEKYQSNLRLAYDWNHTKESHTELGLSGRYGFLDNRTTRRTGDYWSAAVHANSYLGPWNVMLEAIRYEYNPKNPVGVSDDLVLMGNLGSQRLVAAKADIFVGNIAYDFGDIWGPIDRLNVYNNYSFMRKDESSFKDSQINDIGCLIVIGPFWTWIDFILGKNAWYLNDSEVMSGFGPGGTDEWEKRFNVNFEWYF